MKNAVKTLIFALVAIGIFAIFMPTAAKAVGTASGALVTNTATINYDVGGVPQELVESSPTGNSATGVGLGTATTFLVDNIVDLAVATTDGTYVPVSSGGTDYVLTFTVVNEGNTVQDYDLTTSHGNDRFGGYAADDFDATNLRVYVETNGISGYQATDSASGYIDELSADTTETVYIVGDIPGLLSNGDISGIVLTATTYDGGGAAALGALTTESAAPDEADTVQVVFGDGDSVNAGEIDAALNGSHTATSAYRVGAAVLTVTKTEDVLSDPIVGFDPNALHIPGAIVEYTITISNAAAGAVASNITLTDTLDSDLTFVTDTYAAGEGIQVTAPNLYAGAATSLTNATGDDEGEAIAGAITVDGIELQLSESATITYRATIN